MHEILCFGDSNTWGYSPESGVRFPRDVRWTGVLQAALGDGCSVIEEGLSGRTTVWDDPIEGDRNGRRQLPAILESHAPLDLVVILLGTNDLKKRFSASAFDIAAGAHRLGAIVLASSCGRDGRAPTLLLMAPPPVAKLSAFSEMFEGAEEKSRSLGAHYRGAAERLGCHFLDTGTVVRSSPKDGIHLEKDEHRKLGLAVAAEVRRILGA